MRPRRCGLRRRPCHTPTASPASSPPSSGSTPRARRQDAVVVPRSPGSGWRRPARQTGTQERILDGERGSGFRARRPRSWRTTPAICRLIGSCREEAVRGDVQHARRFGAPERGLRGRRSGEQRRRRKEPLDGAALLPRSLAAGRNAPPTGPPLSCCCGVGMGVRLTPMCRRLARARRTGIGNDHGRAPAGASHLHAEEVAAAREVGDGVALDQVAAACVDQRVEWDQVEIAVRGYQQALLVANRRPQQSPSPARLLARARLRKSLLRGIAKRFAEGRNRLVDRLGGAEIEAVRRRILADDVGGVVRRAVSVLVTAPVWDRTRETPRIRSARRRGVSRPAPPCSVTGCVCGARNSASCTPISASQPFFLLLQILICA